MRIPIIPKDIKFEKVTELSPSRFTWLKDGCPYSMLLEMALRKYQTPSLTMPPRSFNNVIGTIIHSIYQSVNNGSLENTEESITKYWKKACEEHTQKILAAYPSLRNVSIGNYDAMFDTIGVLSSLPKESSAQDSTTPGITNPNEHWIIIPGLLKGSIDRIRYNNNGYEIVDYKTGKIHDESGNIKAEYITQLNLYAFMLEDKEGVTVNKLTIIDRQGNKIDVPYHKDQKKEILTSVKDTIDTINSAIESQNLDALKSSSETNCGFCPCYHMCNSRSVLSESPLYIIEGTVTKVWNSDQISIQTNSGKEVTISKLRVLKIENMDDLLGKYLVFANLQEIQEDSLYSRCDKTALYIREK
jgi:CRISPR/Cas system-associated exonuclease Cas4 (RecB family)